jgi:hypothetical protein
MIPVSRLQKLLWTAAIALSLQLASFGQSDDHWMELLAHYSHLLEEGRYVAALSTIEEAAKIAQQFSPDDNRKWLSTIKLADTLDLIGRRLEISRCVGAAT